MRNRILAVSLSTLVSLGILGCGKKKEETPVPTSVEQESIGNPLSPVDEAGKSVATQLEAAGKAAEETGAQAQAELDTQKKTAEKAVADVKTETQAQVKALQERFNTLVSEINTSIDGKLYDQALTQVQKGLGMEDLTEEQEKILQGLKDTIKKAMSQNAADEAKKQVGGLLNKLGK